MDPDRAALLERYAELLREWTPRIALISPADVERVEERHIEDSLKALPWVRSAPPGVCVDVGSGAGFPGIPLAIAEPTRSWRLLEPRARRAAFLEEAVRTLGIDCEVLTVRAEAAAADPRLAGAHSVAVARALAEPPAALALLAPLVRPGGVAVLFLGRAAVPPPGAEVAPEGLAIVRVTAPHPVEDQ